MNTPEAAGDVAERPPRGQQQARQVEFQHLLRRSVRHPEVLVVGHQKGVRTTDVRPRVQELPVLVEDLDPRVRAVADVDTTFAVDGDRVNGVHVAGPRLVGRRALLAPGHQELAVLVELDDPRVDVAVAHEERTVRQPRDVRRPVEVRLVVARHPELAERLHQLLAVVRELVDHVRAIVHEPHVALGVVRVDQHAVRPDEARVVLFPRVDDLAVAVDDEQDVVPAGMLGRILLREVVAGRVAPGDEGVRRTAIVGRKRRQAASHEDEDAVGILRPHAGRRSPGVVAAAGARGPVRDDVIGAVLVAASLLLRPLEGAEWPDDRRDEPRDGDHEQQAGSLHLDPPRGRPVRATSLRDHERIEYPGTNGPTREGT